MGGLININVCKVCNTLTTLNEKDECTECATPVVNINQELTLDDIIEEANKLRIFRGENVD